MAQDVARRAARTQGLAQRVQRLARRAESLAQRVWRDQRVQRLARRAEPLARRAESLALRAERIARRWLSRPAARVAVVGLFWVAVAVFLRRIAERHGYFDLRVYYGALNFWVHGHGELYDYLKSYTEYGFTYPPFAALTMLPMAIVPWAVAIGISTALNVAAGVAVLYWLIDPLARRQGWHRWSALAIAIGFAAAIDPVSETINFGQVNVLLVALVAGDLLVLVSRGQRLGGIGIGLATAIKLTPGIFILYLLITRRFRAAGVATATAGVATMFAAAVIPDSTREFFTDALWNPDRIGSQSFVSNQSLNGFVARLAPTHPSRALWLVLVVGALAAWVWLVRRAAAAGDERAGFALTGIAGCLISPITWVHHLVWLLPAFALLVDYGLDRSLSGRRRGLLALLGCGAYAVLCSRVVWDYKYTYNGWAILYSNAYLGATLVVLVGLALRPPATGTHAAEPQWSAAPDAAEPQWSVGVP